jgi:hypothetical protein
MGLAHSRVLVSIFPSILSYPGGGDWMLRVLCCGAPWRQSTPRQNFDASCIERKGDIIIGEKQDAVLTGALLDSFKVDRIQSSEL